MKIDKENVIESMKDEKTVVLNILPKSDYKKMHIKGSESHPFADDPVTFTKEVEDKYGKGKSFILYGDHFGLLDSFLAAKALEDRGHKALNYPGGMREWYRAGLPVEGTDAVPEPVVVS